MSHTASMFVRCGGNANKRCRQRKLACFAGLCRDFKTVTHTPNGQSKSGQGGIGGNGTSDFTDDEDSVSLCEYSSSCLEGVHLEELPFKVYWGCSIFMICL